MVVACLGMVHQAQASGSSVVRNHPLLHICSGGSVRVYPNGTVSAKPGFDEFSNVEWISAGMAGRIRLYFLETRKFLCFNKRGKLITRNEHKNSIRCVFRENLTDGYTQLESAFSKKWYVGLNKTGHPLPGDRYMRPALRRKRCFDFMKRGLGQYADVEKHNKDVGRRHPGIAPDNIRTVVLQRERSNGKVDRHRKPHLRRDRKFGPGRKHRNSEPQSRPPKHRLRHHGANRHRGR